VPSGSEILAIARLARECEAGGVRAALAHLTRVEGSHYRRSGARMLLAEDGRSAGAISAGCLEADLRLRLEGVLSGGRAESIEYDSRSFEDLAWGLGSGCNGKVRVLLSPFSGRLREAIDGAAAELVAGKTALLATVVEPPGDTRLLAGPEEADRSRESGELVEAIRPPISLLLSGAGPDAVPVARLARQLGWIVSVLSSRDRAFVEARFPGIDVEFAGGAEAVPALRVHARSAAVVMSHSFAEDTENLRALLAREFPYLGVLGPRERTVRLLRATGARPEVADRIHSPVGMNLGAETAEEIALSIVSEIQASFSASAADRSGSPR
jgi:xanthine dehydrogenase accessory factor